MTRTGKDQNTGSPNAVSMKVVITREDFRASLLPVVLNILLTSGLLSFIYFNSETHMAGADLIDFGVEALSAGTYLVLFWAVFLTKLTGGTRYMFAISLLLIQFGRIIDATDEVAMVNVAHASVYGDALTLLGEIILAATAFRWIVRTSRSALTDPLTGLFNRRYHLEQLDRLVEIAKASGIPFAVVAIDLDHFKKVNDQFGHTVGDQVIRHAANVIRNNSRDVDTVSRVGGEEFELLIPNCGQDQAKAISERIRRAIEGNPPEPVQSLTASIGVAVHSTGMNGEKIRDLADAALYQSKRMGRNKMTPAWAMTTGLGEGDTA